jgi:hypothetical protein
MSMTVMLGGSDAQSGKTSSNDHKLKSTRRIARFWLHTLPYVPLLKKFSKKVASQAHSHIK